MASQRKLWLMMQTTAKPERWVFYDTRDTGKEVATYFPSTGTICIVGLADALTAESDRHAVAIASQQARKLRTGTNAAT